MGGARSFERSWETRTVERSRARASVRASVRASARARERSRVRASEGWTVDAGRGGDEAGDAHRDDTTRRGGGRRARHRRVLGRRARTTRRWPVGAVVGAAPAPAPAEKAYGEAAAGPAEAEKGLGAEADAAAEAPKAKPGVEACGLDAVAVKEKAGVDVEVVDAPASAGGASLASAGGASLASAGAVFAAASSVFVDLNSASAAPKMLGSSVFFFVVVVVVVVVDVDGSENVEVDGAASAGALVASTFSRSALSSSSSSNSTGRADAADPRRGPRSVNPRLVGVPGRTGASTLDENLVKRLNASSLPVFNTFTATNAGVTPAPASTDDDVLRRCVAGASSSPSSPLALFRFTRVDRGVSAPRASSPARARLSRRASSSPVASLGAGLSRPRFVPIATATASRANRVFPPIDADADAESRRLPGVSAFANDLESRRGARMDFTLDAGERAGSSGAPPPR